MKEYAREKKSLLTSDEASSSWVFPLCILALCLIIVAGISIASNVRRQGEAEREQTVGLEESSKDSKTDSKPSEENDDGVAENNPYARAEDSNLIAALPEYFVERVVDGDTIDVVRDGHQTRVRLIGVNTPESVKKGHPVECFGPESSNFAKNSLTRRNVRLEGDPSQDDVDVHGRILRYVYVNNQNFNLTLIREGYGKEYTFNLPYKYQVEFRRAEQEAKSSNKGLWSPQTCNGS